MSQPDSERAAAPCPELAIEPPTRFAASTRDDRRSPRALVRDGIVRAGLCRLSGPTPLAELSPAEGPVLFKRQWASYDDRSQAELCEGAR